MDVEKLMQLSSGFLQCLHDGIAVVDNKGKIVFVNAANDRITGIPQEKLLGYLVSEMVPHSHVPEVLKTGQEMIGVQTEVNGKQVLSNIVPLIINGEMLGAVSVFQELDEVLELTQRLEEAHVTINQLVKKLQTIQGNSLDMVIGSSPAMVQAVNLAKKSAMVESNVLIRGESGSGKEVIARLIHSSGSRKNQPFIAVNCAAIPEMLLESELFGYEEGAFTGAKKGGHAGLVESANGGTLFLDEIGDMPLILQGKILRLLQEKKYMSVGCNRYKNANVRFIAATNSPLERMISNKSFREDLYYRLGVIKIDIPPLRDRKEDLVKYIDHIVEKIASKMEKPSPTISKTVFKAMYDYGFPGNLRELENILEMAFVLDEDGVLDMDDTPALKHEYPINEKSVLSDRGIVLEFDNVPSLKDLEKAYFVAALDKVSNRRQLSMIAGIARSTLYQKLDQHNLKK